MQKICIIKMSDFFAGISVGVVIDSTQDTSDGKADCYAVFELTPSGCQKSRFFRATLSRLQFARVLSHSLGCRKAHSKK